MIRFSSAAQASSACRFSAAKLCRMYTAPVIVLPISLAWFSTRATTFSPMPMAANCDATVRRRSCGVAGLFVQPELLQRPMHGMCDTMRREMLLALDQSRSRPAREEEWRFARQLRCLPEELHSHRRQRDGMISTVFYTPCRDQPLGLVEIDLRLHGAADLADPLAGNQGEPKRELGARRPSWPCPNRSRMRGSRPPTVQRERDCSLTRWPMP